YGAVYPNLFVLWLAITTLWRKSTALDVARVMARQAIPHLLAPQDTTPESFLTDLSGREPTNLKDLPPSLQGLWQQERNFAAQRGLVLDELSGLLAGAGKDYNAGLLEAFLRFYDCDPQYTRSTRGSGRVVVQNAYLSILGASTPAAMAQHVTEERLWSNGWWARFAILTPEESRPEWIRATEPDLAKESHLVQGLRSLYEVLPASTWPDPPEARPVLLGPGVMAAWEAYNKALSYDLLTPDLDYRLHGSYGRMPTQCLKVATILAAMDWRGRHANAPEISLGHLARAMATTEGWRASAHRALAAATVSEFDRLQRRIIRCVSKREPDGATLRDIYRQMADKTPAEIKAMVVQLVEIGMLEEARVDHGKQGGRPSFRYCLAK
ncbi:MAG: DUF3987 domain-containing protein, partial [Planctomycetes bacterium]|nr:DUF3987 domain-containing protein [Planctomycetota bacterium]